jgi:mannan endo-1,4-beta-mannosidase
MKARVNKASRIPNTATQSFDNIAYSATMRFSSYIKPSSTDDYTVYTASDDGVRLWIYDKLVIDNWTCHAESEDVCRFPMEAGHFYKIRLEYFEASGLRGQRIRLYWEAPSVAKEYVPEANLFFTK